MASARHTGEKLLSNFCKADTDANTEKFPKLFSSHSALLSVLDTHAASETNDIIFLCAHGILRKNR